MEYIDCNLKYLLVINVVSEAARRLVLGVVVAIMGLSMTGPLAKCPEVFLCVYNGPVHQGARNRLSQAGLKQHCNLFITLGFLERSCSYFLLHWLRWL